MRALQKKMKEQWQVKETGGRYADLVMHQIHKKVCMKIRHIKIQKLLTYSEMFEHFLSLAHSSSEAAYNQPILGIPVWLFRLFAIGVNFLEFQACKML